mmetsp:Transcript_40582/g.82995  ORF Transcript_40582/g.82995 Transcript_40582/m.82995 type:complete len:152 (-) Transcript_40582:778-1233(-)
MPAAARSKRTESKLRWETKEEGNSSVQTSAENCETLKKVEQVCRDAFAGLAEEVLQYMAGVVMDGNYLLRKEGLVEVVASLLVLLSLELANDAATAEILASGLREAKSLTSRPLSSPLQRQFQPATGSAPKPEVLLLKERCAHGRIKQYQR